MWNAWDFLRTLVVELLVIWEGLLLGINLVDGSKDVGAFWVESDCMQAVSAVSKDLVEN